MVAPFMTGAALSAKIATAGVNLMIGVAIWSLLVNVAGSAVRRAVRRTDRYILGHSS